MSDKKRKEIVFQMAISSYFEQFKYQNYGVLSASFHPEEHAVEIKVRCLM